MIQYVKMMTVYGLLRAMTDILKDIHLIEKIIQFKNSLIEPELETIDNRLRTIIFSLAGFISYNFGKSLLITELYRTQAMQDEYYKNDPMYQKNKFVSVHQVGRGCDASLKYFTPEEINKIYIFLNTTFPYATNSKLKTALIHEVNDMGNHLHLQCGNEAFTKILKT